MAKEGIDVGAPAKLRGAGVSATTDHASQPKICLSGASCIVDVDGAQHAIVAGINVVEPLAPILEAGMDGVASMRKDHVIGKLPGSGMEDLQQPIHAISKAAEVDKRQPIAKIVGAGNPDLLA